MNKFRSNEIIQKLIELIENPRCELNYNNVFELAVATVLSAQTKDSRVNEVTKELFEICPTPEILANYDYEKIEKILAPLGLAKTKAKNIISLSSMLVEKYSGIVPNTIEELMSLPGIGRKTASVILVEGFKIPAIPVDTHVLRVANRLGFSKSDNPIKVEEDLKRFILPDKWIISHHLFIHFGRYHCTSKKPKCDGCTVKRYCKYNNKQEE